MSLDKLTPLQPWSDNVLQAKSEVQKWEELREQVTSNINSLERTLELDRKHFEQRDRIEQLTERTALTQRRLHDHELAELSAQLTVLHRARKTHSADIATLQVLMTFVFLDYFSFVICYRRLRLALSK